MITCKSSSSSQRATFSREYSMVGWLVCLTTSGPRVPVTDDVYRRCITKSVRVRCTKLVFAYESTDEWGAVFRQNIQKTKAEGGYGTLEATFKDAERLWREHSPAYQRCRSVARPGKLPDGRLNIRRTRLPQDTEAEYRKRIRQDVPEERVPEERVPEERVVQDQRIDESIILWQQLRPVVHKLTKKLSKRGVATRAIQQDDVRHEIEHHIENYEPPREPTAAMADLILLEVQRRLFNNNNNEEEEAG
ncbi:uncharacterized protein LOC144887459 [Branchiostoma floridae x Branchiostoma japonicum]